MRKTLCYTVADKGSVCINGVSIPCGDDGWKKVILTDEIKKTYNKPWVDLRDTDLKIWKSDCNGEEVYTFTKEDLGTWGVEINSRSITGEIYLIKYGE